MKGADASVICTSCTATAGQTDRCQSCQDFSAFQVGDFSMRELEALSGRGKLAFLLSALAAMKAERTDDEG